MNVFSADVALAITRLGLLILLGWFMARQGWVGAHARQPLMRMIIWVFFPAMIFSRVSGNPLIASGSQALLYLGAGFLMIVTGYAVATLIGSVFKVPAGTARRTFAFSAGVNNFGYLGIPVTAALFDHDVIGVLLVHNVGVEAAVWTASGRAPRSSSRATSAIPSASAPSRSVRCSPASTCTRSSRTSGLPPMRRSPSG
jgi:predicted permease